MTDTPDLASAARDFLVDIDANITGSVADYLAKASAPLRAALAGHDQRDEPECIRGIVDSAGGGEVRVVVNRDTERYPSVGSWVLLIDPDNAKRLREALSDHTTEQRWIDSTGAINVPTPRGEPIGEQHHHLPATPEGGELDDLLARVDAALPLMREIGNDGPAGLVADLAAALRRKREDHKLTWAYAQSLERPLASHGEVLARTTTLTSGYVHRREDGALDLDEGGTTSLVKLYHVPCPPGTEVLIVRAQEKETDDGE